MRKSKYKYIYNQMFIKKEKENQDKVNQWRIKTFISRKKAKKERVRKNVILVLSSKNKMNYIFN